MLVEELTTRGLARPTEDGVSVPLHPVVRSTILVLLGQLARSTGQRRGIDVHPATSDPRAARDLVATLSRQTLPSAGHVVALDLQAVTLNLDPVPLDELLDFRSRHLDAHRSYMRNLRGLLVELSMTAGANRTALLEQRRDEISAAADELGRTARRAFTKGLAAWSLGLAGAAWAAATGDPLSLALSAAGLTIGAVPGAAAPLGAYTDLFAAARRLER